MSQVSILIVATAGSARFLAAYVLDSPVWQFLSNLHWHGAWRGRDTEGVLIIIAVFSSWIAGVRMRRKIKKDLGRKATDADLTSIDTWMKVDEQEERNGRKNLPKPD